MSKSLFLFAKVAVLASLVSACDVQQFTKPAPRQKNLVIYDGPTEFVKLSTPAAQKVTQRCGHLFTDTLESWANPRSGYALHFGVMYGVYDPKGSNCTFASDGDAGSVKEISYVVKRLCETLHKKSTGNDVTCIPVAIARPKGVNNPHPGAVGKRQGDELLKELAAHKTGYGSMATAADGRWSVYVRDTREEADQVALANCQKLHGLGLDSYTPQMLDEVKASCNIIYRFGPDYPGARNVTVIR